MGRTLGSVVLVAIALSSGCAKPVEITDLKPNVPRPSGLATTTFRCEKVTGFDKAFREEHHLGPETTYAGYSKAYTVDLPTKGACPKLDSKSGLNEGSFLTPFGGRVYMFVPDPVDYKFGDPSNYSLGGKNPKEEISIARATTYEDIRKRTAPRTYVANGWAGEESEPMVVGHKVYLGATFYSSTDVLAYNMTWVEGNAEQEAECRSLIPYVLWSIKVKD